MQAFIPIAANLFALEAPYCTASEIICFEQRNLDSTFAGDQIKEGKSQVNEKLWV
jgi:hypothetical protein